MNNIIVFVPKNLALGPSKEISDLLLVHNIKTTDNISEANVVLTPYNLKNNLVELALLLWMEEIDAKHKIELVLPRAIEPISLPETNKKTYTKYQSQNLHDTYIKIKHNRNNYIKNTRKTRHK